MHFSKKITMFVITILCLSLTLLGCVDNKSQNKSPEEQLDNYVEDIYSQYNSPASSLSILVVDDGEQVYKKSFGYANIDTMEKADSSTNYRLASVTKMFTAMSAMILKDRGLLDYDTKVNEILADFPEYGKDITVMNLLRHMSGLRDYYDLMDLLDDEFDQENQLLDSDVYEIVKKADSTYFEPGESFRYSDTGYVVLGLVVEKISGMPLYEFMKKNIFTPLEMENTVAFDKRQNPEINNRAYGTKIEGDQFITKDQSAFSAVLGDGGVYSSLDDLYKWDQALYEGLERDILVSKETLQEAYTPPKILNEENDNYNFGWFFMENEEGDLEQVHTGGTQGFSTFYLRIPERKKTLIILSNKNDDDAAYDSDSIVRELYNFGGYNKSSNNITEEQLDNYVEKIYSKYDSPTPSLSILVVDDGEAVYKKSIGYANIETMEKANSSTNYRLASLSKMFNGMSIMILKDRGLLDYDTKVIDILEDFPEYGKDITVRHLINNRSGLRDYYDYVGLLDDDFDENNQLLDSDVYEIIKRMDSTHFKPGELFRFSDTDYVVLGLLIEKISGMSLSEFMDKNIFIPLEMDNTVLFDKRQNFKINNRAYGTSMQGKNFIIKDQSSASAVLGDGGVYSSLDDLYKWDKALYEGLERDILVSKETLQEAYTPTGILNHEYNNYNFGWIFRKNGAGEFEEFDDGATQGTTTFYLRVPEKKKSLIILSNRNNDEVPYSLESIVRDIYDFGDE